MGFSPYLLVVVKELKCIQVTLKSWKLLYLFSFWQKHTKIRLFSYLMSNSKEFSVDYRLSSEIQGCHQNGCHEGS